MIGVPGRARGQKTCIRSSSKLNTPLDASKAVTIHHSELAFPTSLPQQPNGLPQTRK